MRSHGLVLALISCLPVVAAGNDLHWNQFRGPRGDGSSLAKNVPVKFSETDNIRWKTPIPGAGWSSPVVWDNQVWLTSGRQDGRELFAICVDAASGKVLRNIKVLEVADPDMEWNQNPHACPTPFMEEGRLYVHRRPAVEVAAEIKQARPTSDEQKNGKIDWEKAYQKLLKDNPDIRKKVENGGATKAQVIAWMKSRGKKGSNEGSKEKRSNGVTNFYAIVIGKLKTKDVELGEFTLAVDHVTSMYGNRWVKNQVVGKTIKVTGVSGPFRDKLLLIKRGETLKFRSGSYIADQDTMTFGAKFHVLERANPFKPEDFGVPPKDFRGFGGVLQGKVVEANGYEVLMTVDRVIKVADDSKAADAGCIEGKRVRVVGFYNQHADAFGELHEGDTIRVSVAHRNPDHDELQVTNELEQVNQ